MPTPDKNFLFCNHGDQEMLLIQKYIFLGLMYPNMKQALTPSAASAESDRPFPDLGASAGAVPLRGNTGSLLAAATLNSSSLWKRLGALLTFT